MDVAGQRHHVGDALRLQEGHQRPALGVVAIPLVGVEEVLVEQRRVRQLRVDLSPQGRVEGGAVDAGAGQHGLERGVGGMRIAAVRLGRREVGGQRRCHGRLQRRQRGVGAGQRSGHHAGHGLHAIELHARGATPRYPTASGGGGSAHLLLPPAALRVAEQRHRRQRIAGAVDLLASSVDSVALGTK